MEKLEKKRNLVIVLSFIALAFLILALGYYSADNITGFLVNDFNNFNSNSNFDTNSNLNSESNSNLDLNSPNLVFQNLGSVENKIFEIKSFDEINLESQKEKLKNKIIIINPNFNSDLLVSDRLKQDGVSTLRARLDQQKFVGSSQSIFGISHHKDNDEDGGEGEDGYEGDGYGDGGEGDGGEGEDGDGGDGADFDDDDDDSHDGDCVGVGDDGDGDGDGDGDEVGDGGDGDGDDGDGDNGDDCEDELYSDCESNCDGKIIYLKLNYTGTNFAIIRVEQKHEIVVFNDFVNPGEIFNFSGADNHGTLSSKIKIFVNNAFDSEIHTSCSKPIGPGMQFGNFKIVSGKSRHGGELYLYNYSCLGNYTGNQTGDNNTNTTNNTFSTNTSLFLNGIRGNLNLISGQISTALAVTSYGNVNLYRDGVLVVNPEIVNLGVGYYNYTAINYGGINYTGSSETWFLNVGANTTKMQDNVSLFLNGVSSNLSLVYGVVSNASASSLSGTEVLYRDGVLVLNPEIGILPVGLYSYFANSSESLNYFGDFVGENFYLDVSPANSFCNLSFDLSSPQVYGQSIVASCSCSSPESSSVLLRDGFDVTSLENGVGVVLGAGVHNYSCSVFASQNYTGVSVNYSFVVDKLVTNTSLFLNGFESDLNLFFGDLSNVSAITDFGSVSLYRDGVLVVNPEIASLGIGYYNYTAVNYGNSNYSFSFETWFLNVSKLFDNVSLFLNGLSANLSLVYGVVSNVSASSLSGAESLYRDGVLVVNPEIGILPVGWYSYFANSSDGLNYFGDFVGENFYLDVSPANSFCNLSFDLLSPQIYGSSIVAGCSCSSPEFSAVLLRDGFDVTSLENGVGVVLGAGVHNYSCSVFASQNYTGASLNGSFLIDKKLTSTNLFLNGVSGNLDLFFGQVSNVSAITDYGSVSLYRDGVIVTNPEITNLGVGYYNYTAINYGNSNYSGSSASWFLNVSKLFDNVSLFLNGLSANLSLVYGQVSNASASSLSGTEQIYRDGVLVLNPEIGILPVGLYSYFANSSESLNYFGDFVGENFYLDVSPANSFCNLSFDLSSPQVYGSSIVASCSCSSPESSAVLLRDGFDVTSLENGVGVVLGVGVYNYSCGVFASQNYTGVSVNYSFVVDKKLTSTNLFLNGVSGNLDLFFGDLSNVSAVTDFGSVSLYRDGVIVTNPEIASLGVGYYNYTAVNYGNSNYSFSFETWFLNVSKLFDNVSLFLNGVSSNLSLTYGSVSNASASSLSGTEQIYRDGVIVLNPDVGVLGVGLYSYFANSSESLNYFGDFVGENFYLDVSPANSFCNLSFDLLSPQIYGQSIVAGCSCSSPESSAVLLRDGFDVTSVENGVGVVLGAGVHNYSCGVFASQNFTGVSVNYSFVVDKKLTSTNLFLNGVSGNLDLFFGQVSNVSAITDYGTVNLYRDGVLVVNPEIASLGVGYYNYTAINYGGINYSGSSASWFLNVSKLFDNVSLFLNGVSSNLSLVYGVVSNASASSLSGAESLYRDGVLVSNPEIGILPVGLYSYFANSSDGLNYFGDLFGENFYLDVSPANSFCNLSFDLSSPQVYGSSIVTGCFCSSPESSSVLLRDGFDVTSVETGVGVVLGAGVHNYSCNVFASQNYTGANLSGSFVISPANPVMGLFLNGTQGPVTFERGVTLNVTGIINLGDVNYIELWLGSTLVMSGPSPLEYISLYDSQNYYNYTLIYPATENYSEVRISHMLSVFDTIPTAQITNLNLTHVNMTWISFDWTPPSDLDYAQGNIYLNGFNIANTSYDYYTAIGLTPDTNYTIQVNAVDFFGNINISTEQKTIRTLKNCTENWVANYASCLINDTKLKTYTDLNSCGTIKNLPIDNSSYVACDYCKPNWVAQINSCTASDQYLTWYNDTNNCYAQTGLLSDKNGPANISSTCDYINSTNFNGASTNLTSVDLSNMSNLFIERLGYGSINFSEIISLNRNVSFNAHITIDNNLIAVDTLALPELNKKARLSFANISFNVVEIVRNGVVCLAPNCNYISYSGTGGIAVFNVSDMANYYLRESLSSAPYFTNISLVSGGNYTTNSTYLFESTWEDNIAIEEVLLEIRGTNYSYFNGNITTNLIGNKFNISLGGFSAGTHKYRWYARDINSNWNISSWYNFTINPVIDTISLLLNGFSSNLTLTYGQISNASANSLSGTESLYRDSVSVLNPDVGILGVGIYSYHANSTGGQNYSANNLGQSYSLEIIRAVPSCTVVFDKLSPQIYGTLINVSCECTNSETNSLLYKNGIDVSLSEMNKLVKNSAGIYNYTCFSAQSQNYTLAQNNSLFNISQIEAITGLFLDGVNAPLTVERGSIVNLTGRLIVGEVNYLELYLGGNFVMGGPSPLEYITLYNSQNYYNYTLIYPASENYSEVRLSHMLSVFDTIPPAQIQNLNATNVGISSIRWDWTKPSDLDYNLAKIYLNGVNVLNTSYDYYIATGLNDNTNYTISIGAMDYFFNLNNSFVNNTQKTILNCTENWVANYTICSTNDTKLKTYYDANTCGTINNLPIDNSSYVACDYCKPNWQENKTSCQIDDTKIGYYIDVNNCYSQTGLASDNFAPKNKSYSCLYLNMTKFNGNTSVLNNSQLTNITGFALEILGIGKINFTSPVSFGRSINFNEEVLIKHNSIIINSTKIPELNVSAQIKLYNINWTNPQILLNGQVCPVTICNIINYNNITQILEFNVSHFTNYSSHETGSFTSLSITPQTSDVVVSSGGGGGGVFTTANSDEQKQNLLGNNLNGLEDEIIKSKIEKKKKCTTGVGNCETLKAKKEKTIFDAGLKSEMNLKLQFFKFTLPAIISMIMILTVGFLLLNKFSGGGIKFKKV